MLLAPRGSRGRTFLWTAGDCCGLSGLRQHLQFEQLGEQDGIFTFVALATETQDPFKDMALLAPSVADRALATYAALVQGVGHQPARRADGAQRVACTELRPFPPITA